VSKLQYEHTKGALLSCFPGAQDYESNLATSSLAKKRQRFFTKGNPVYETKERIKDFFTFNSICGFLKVIY
jgi:hypothetical protein